MPRKPPAEPIDHHYNIPKLNRAFFAAGALLTAVFLLMVVADYKRDWKSIQQTFLRQERDKLRGQLVAARNDIRSHARALAKLNAHLKELDPKIYAADQNAKFLKASFDATRYTYEDDLANRPKAAPKSRREVDKIEKELNAANLKLAQLKKDETETRDELKRITARRDEAQASIEKMSADYKLAQ